MWNKEIVHVFVCYRIVLTIENGILYHVHTTDSHSVEKQSCEYRRII